MDKSILHPKNAFRSVNPVFRYTGVMELLFCQVEPTEIPYNVKNNLLGIKDYTFETEKTQSLRRVSAYIKKTVNYKRRFD